jgi:hypothetical protein
MFEIYVEKIYDLLSESFSEIKVKERRGGGGYLPD